jgi:hypothetical protein
MDNLVAEGKARPFILVIGTSYIPGMSRDQAVPGGARFLRPAAREVLGALRWPPARRLEGDADREW